MSDTTTTVDIARVTRDGSHHTRDVVAQEEPLEIRIEGRPVAITMRTPGHDVELAAGFLYTEGVIDGHDDIRAMAHVDEPSDPKGNTIDTLLAPGVPAGRRHAADRSLFASSSCGVCGKATIDRLLVSTTAIAHPIEPNPEVLFGLPDRLRTHQAVFAQTGGLHAAALFDVNGELEVAREDIGRHNAVDKVIGWKLHRDEVPIEDRILLVSGRAGFEIIQKALVARISIVAAVGAPSSMAVELAEESGMLIVGFLRDGRYNQYGRT